MPSLAHQRRVSVRVGERDLGGTFRTADATERSADGSTVRPGGMAPGVAMAGPSEYADKAYSRLLEHTTDSGLLQWCMDNIGSRMVAVEQPLDSRGQAGFHQPTTVSGLLIGASESDYDADGTDPWVLTLTMKPDSVT